MNNYSLPPSGREKYALSSVCNGANDPQIAQSQQELKAFIRACLTTFDIRTRAATGRDTVTADFPWKRKDALQSLLAQEKTDENFHKYAFVRDLRERIELMIGPLVDVYCQNIDQDADSAANDPTVIPALSERIMLSKEYTNFLAAVVEEARVTVKGMVLSPNAKEKSPEAFSHEGDDQENGIWRSSHRKWKMDGDARRSSASTAESSGSVSPPVPPYTAMKSLVANLNPQNAVEVRRAAIKSLAGHSTSDLLSMEFWSDVRAGLEIALGDSDHTVVMAALRLYSRAFRAAPPHFTGEVYSSFVSHLISHFQNACPQKLSDGINIFDPKMDLLIRKFRLLNQFQIELPSFWARFPDALIKEVTALTIKFLALPLPNASADGDAIEKHNQPPVTGTSSISSTNALPGVHRAYNAKDDITPLHCMAVCDPGFKWFEKWMVSAPGRSAISSALRDRGLGSFLASFVIMYSEKLPGYSSQPSSDTAVNSPNGGSLQKIEASMTRNDEVVVMDLTDDMDDEHERHLDERDRDGNSNADQSTEVISGQDMDYARFLNALVMLVRLLLCSAGRECFPIPLMYLDSSSKKGELSITEFINLLIRLMTGGSRICLSPSHSRTDNTQGTPFSTSIGDASLNLSRFVCKLLLDVITCDLQYREEIFKDHLLDDLTSPVQFALNPSASKPSQSHSIEDSFLVLYHIAEVLSHIAATDAGRRFLLSGEKGFCSNSAPITAYFFFENAFSRPALHVVVTFVRRALATLAQQSKGARTFAESPNPTTSYPGTESVSPSSDSQPRPLPNRPPLRVISAFIFFLRQLYRTCPGLLALRQYDLHQDLARVLADRPSSAQHPSRSMFLPSDRKDSSGAKMITDHSGMSSSMTTEEWVDTTLDNLLNFAGTPLGVLLLKQSGAMDDCVAYMYQRYQKKMHVSKCEKFGYGVLVSQIAATAPGMRALYNAGLISSFLGDLWAMLQHEKTTPSTFPQTDFDDHHSRKVVTNVMKAFASYPGLLTVIELERAQSQLQVPSTLPMQSKVTVDEKSNFLTLFRRLVLMECGDSSGGGRSEISESLVCCEESHNIGLRIAGLLASSLDSNILLQSEFGFVDRLFRLQQENRVPTIQSSDTQALMVDESTLLRNRMLIAVNLIGGPTERILPPAAHQHYVKQTENAIVDPPYIITKLPIPDCYAPDLSGTFLNQTALAGDRVYQELQSLLDRDPTQDPVSWLETTRIAVYGILCNADEKNGTQKRSSFPIPLAMMRKIFIKSSSAICSAAASSGNVTQEAKWGLLGQLKPAIGIMAGPAHGLGKHGEIGVELFARHAFRFHKSIAVERHAADLGTLLRRVDIMLMLQRTQDESNGSVGFAFDWFAAVAYLLFVDQRDAFVALEALSRCELSLYVWPARAHDYAGLKGGRGGIPLVYAVTSHLVETILQSELPILASAFTLSGCTPSQICQTWLREMFLNALDTPAILSYITLILLFGIDYQVYFCIALFRHLERHLLSAARKSELIEFLSQGGFRDFAVRNQMAYMRSLEENWRDLCVRKMRTGIEANGEVDASASASSK